MIIGAPKYVMATFFGVGILLLGFSIWALYLTDIPQEQFQNDPRFEEEYIKYYEWLSIFGIVLIIIGGIVAVLGRKMTKK
jgi:formate hydrogenlyase subunit 3/multisubunit Na+/H+ antiporter MnhD subunit